MIRILLTCSIVLMLAACKTTSPSFGSFSEGDPCVVAEGEVMCKETSTEQQQADWAKRVTTEPVLDPKEKAVLAWCKPSAAADIASTAVAFAVCPGAKELNLVCGWIGDPVGIVVCLAAVSYGACELFEYKAAKSPESASTADSILWHNWARVGLAAWNSGQIVTKCL